MGVTSFIQSPTLSLGPETGPEKDTSSNKGGTRKRNRRGHAVLRIAERERDRLVVQLGTSVSGGEVALRVANQLLEHADCAGIDINMGCPK